MRAILEEGRQRQMGGGKALIVETLFDQRLEVGEAIHARQVDGGTQLGHLRLDGIEPGHFAIVLEQPIALAHGLFIVGH